MNKGLPYYSLLLPPCTRVRRPAKSSSDRPCNSRKHKQDPTIKIVKLGRCEKTENEHDRALRVRHAISPARRRRRPHGCRRRARSGKKTSAPFLSLSQMARVACVSSPLSSLVYSQFVRPGSCEGDKLISGFGFRLFEFLGPLRSAPIARSELDGIQSVPFRLRALGARAEVDRAQPQAEATDGRTYASVSQERRVASAARPVPPDHAQSRAVSHNHLLLRSPQAAAETRSASGRPCHGGARPPPASPPPPRPATPRRRPASSPGHWRRPPRHLRFLPKPSREPSPSPLPPLPPPRRPALAPPPRPPGRGPRYRRSPISCTPLGFSDCTV
jgi:hypothetical protein